MVAIATVLKTSRRFIIVSDLNCGKFRLIENIYQVFGNFFVLGTKLNTIGTYNYVSLSCNQVLDAETLVFITANVGVFSDFPVG